MNDRSGGVPVPVPFTSKASEAPLFLPARSVGTADVDRERDEEVGNGKREVARIGCMLTSGASWSDRVDKRDV